MPAAGRGSDPAPAADKAGALLNGLRLPDLPGGELTWRLATAAAALPLVILVVLAGGEALAAVASAVLAVAFLEFVTAGGLRRRDPLIWAGAAGVVAITAVSLSADVSPSWPLTVGVVALLALPIGEELIRPLGAGAGPEPSFREMAQRSALALGGFVYVGWLGGFIVRLRELPAGDEWLLLALLAVMAVDTGAYATGRALGRRPLAPRISPKKTLEGALGGWAAGFTAVILLRFLPDIEIAYWRMVLLALVLPLLAELGDLTASVIKRALDIKDFSHLLPGHGGVLDRLDSLLFGVPTVYLFVRWIAL